MNSGLKKKIKSLFPLINYLPFNNRLKGKGLKIKYNKAILIRNKIKSNGSNNEIVLGKGTFIKKCKIQINGSNNRIIIGEGSSLKNVIICIEDDGNTLLIGNKTHFSNGADLSVIEGTQILIGNDVLFSSDITIRTGDSHSVLDLQGRRINQSKSVEIADHVWVGHRVIINKGVHIAKNSVVGIGSVVTKKFEDANITIGGNPAKIIKENINWDTKRI